MKQSTLVTGLAVATLLGAAALYLDGGLERNDRDTDGELLFPDLLASVNQVARLETRHQGRSFGADVVDGRWVVPERGGYPASGEAIRKIIVAMAGIKKIEAMTANPERYPKLGLEPPDDKQAYSVALTLYDDSRATLAGLVLGYRDPSKTDDANNEIYVRRIDDPQSWLVSADVPHPTAAKDLLALDVADIALSRVHRVHTRQPGDRDVIVGRETPEDETFIMQNSPEGTQVLYDWAINDIGRVFTALQLVDVRDATTLDFSQPQFSLRLTTFDGLELHMESVNVQAGQFARLMAKRVEPVVSSDVHESLLPLAEVDAEVDALNAAWAGWGFQFTSYRYSTFSKPMRELVTEASSASD